MWARAQKGQLGCVCVAAVPTRCWQGPEKEHLLLTSPHLLSLYSTAKVFPVEPEGAGPQLLDWKEDLRLGAEAQGWGSREGVRKGCYNLDFPSLRMEWFLHSAGSGN